MADDNDDVVGQPDTDDAPTPTPVGFPLFPAVILGPSTRHSISRTAGRSNAKANRRHVSHAKRSTQKNP